MRVPQDDSGAAAARRICEDQANGKGNLSLIAIVAREVDAIEPIVEVRHEQAFPSRIGFREAAGEEIAGCCEPVELERPFGTLIAHAGELCGGPPRRDSNCDRVKPNSIHNGDDRQACAGHSAH